MESFASYLSLLLDILIYVLFLVLKKKTSMNSFLKVYHLLILIFTKHAKRLQNLFLKDWILVLYDSSLNT